nr:MAG: hypothetical protein 3 [Leviviridae sp.]
MSNRNISRISGMYRHNASASYALASEIFLGLGSELSRQMASALQSGNHKLLLNRSLDPNAYSDPWSFRDDYLAVELMSKYPYLDVNIDREAVALEKFHEAEMHCSETNKRLSGYVGSIHSPYTPLSILTLARCKIAGLLGSFSWDLAEHHFGFGPGSTTSLPRKSGDAYFKFGAVRPHVTRACSVLSLLAISRVPKWFSHLAGLAGESPGDVSELPIDLQVEKLLTIVPGNRVTTVPKSAKTDRVIAIEPDLNMYIQKGIGGLLRSRLKRVGIDLDDQVRNQVLCREGSLTGALATIDLSSASDTVSMRLVEDLLPPDWVSAIKLCRSPRGTLPNGELITYHKVSSMGNGFTFELESLIFWAICSSVISLFNPSETRLAVYGDDIILSSSIFATVKWILEFCGFTVNPSKSFASGPFRESCGKHFFSGVEVTPFYIRDDIESPDRLIWIANSIRRWCIHRYSSGEPSWGLDGRLYKAYSSSVDLLPSSLRKPSSPIHFGDISLFGDVDECTPTWSKRLHCLIAIGVSDIRDTFVPGECPYLLRSLSMLERRSIRKSAVWWDMDTGDSSGVIKNSYKRRWKILKLPTTRWESYGPWLSP